jgi:putative endonuclease
VSKTADEGRNAENSARVYLEQQGLQLLTRNFRCKYGEIDLIMQDRDMLVFIEVRLRRNLRYGGALASITPDKQRKLLTTAEIYLQQHNARNRYAGMRFDVLGLSETGDNTEFEWIKNAFGY